LAVRVPDLASTHLLRGPIGDDLARHMLEKPFGGGLVVPPCSRRLSSAPRSSTTRHSRHGSPRSVTDISSRCHVPRDLQRAAFTLSAKRAPNFSYQR
jgi:hypothetical protein